MRRLREVVRPGSAPLVPALSVAFAFLVVVPIAADPPIVLNVRAALAEQIVNQLRSELSIKSEIDIALVKYHPLVFFVEPQDKQKRRFRLSMEARFLLMLDDEELVGALAHELGHVWIYTHHPFLQTEMLANEIGQRVAPRRSFERAYTKLWAYEKTSGVPMDELLGPSETEDSSIVPPEVN